MTERKLFTPEARSRIVELERERKRELEQATERAKAQFNTKFDISPEALQSLSSSMEEVGKTVEEQSQLMHEMFEKFANDYRGMTKNIFPEVRVTKRRRRLFGR